MDDALMRSRVAGASVARLATVRGDGSPHLVPCCFVLDGDTVLTAVDDIKPKSSLALARLDHLASHPQVSLLVDHYQDDWSGLWWVRLDATGRIVDPGADRERALDQLGAKYPPYARRRPPGAVIALAVASWHAWP